MAGPETRAASVAFGDTFNRVAVECLLVQVIFSIPLVKLC
jgi:hypothetical protein